VPGAFAPVAQGFEGDVSAFPPSRPTIRLRRFVAAARMPLGDARKGLEGRRCKAVADPPL
jgi:hypothetical protein